MGKLVLSRGSSHRCRVEQHQRVVQFPVLRSGFLRPLATSSMRWNISQPTSAMVLLPSAMVPALMSIKSCHCRAHEVAKA